MTRRTQSAVQPRSDHSLCRVLSLMLISVLLLAGDAVGSTATAQTRAPSNGAPPTAAPVLGPSDFLNAALQVVAAVDQFDMGSVWDRSSQLMRSTTPKDRFVANTAQRRATLGAVRSRDWLGIARSVVTQAGGSLPQGQYITVRLATSGQNGSTMEEVISFHLDPDGQWRLAGYTLQ